MLTVHLGKVHSKNIKSNFFFRQINSDAMIVDECMSLINDISCIGIFKGKEPGIWTLLNEKEIQFDYNFLWIGYHYKRKK